MTDPQLPQRVDFDAPGEVLPARPRYRYLTPLTAMLMALILGGVGFYAGVRIEKTQLGAAGSGASAPGHTRHGKAAAAGLLAASGAGAFAGGRLASRLAAAFGGGGKATAGSVTQVAGDTLYVTEASGNTVEVRLSPATKITKSEHVTRRAIFPGDQVLIAGSKGAGGTVDATTVTDTGAAAGGASSSTATSSAGGASSAISSLFGGG